MRSNVMHLVVLFAMFAVAGLAGQTALGAEVRLEYEPEAGDIAEYALQVHAEAMDSSGQSLITHATSTVRVEVVDVKRDAGSITQTVVEILQKDGAVTFTSGEKTEQSALKDSKTRVVTDAEGNITKVLAGSLERSFIAELSRVCATLGKTERPTKGQKWTVPVKFNFGGETADGAVEYELAGTQKVDGADCIIISSTGKVAHTFKEQGPVRSITFAWVGKVYYDDSRGRFAGVYVKAEAAGTLDDGASATVKEMTLQMSPLKKGAALPKDAGASGVLAGGLGGFPTLPMFFALALIGGVAICVAKVRGRVLRQAFVFGLGLVLAVYGMPVGVAEAAGAESLVAFSQMSVGALMDASGFSAAGGAGICMTGTKAGSIGTVAAITPASGGATITAAAGGVPVAFIGGAPAAAPAAAAGAGLFTTTNALIAGGVIVAGGGAYALGSGGGSSGGTKCPTSTLDDITAPNLPGTIFFNIKTRGNEAPDTPRDRVEVWLNNVQVGTVDIEIAQTLLGPFAINVGDNDFELRYAGGGSNNCAILQVVTFPTTDPGNVHLQDNIWVGPAQTTASTITRQP